MDNDEMEQVGYFVDFVFIVAALFIAYLTFNTYGDKIQYIVLILVAYFIHKAIMDYILKNWSI